MVGTDYAGTYKNIYNYTYSLGWHFRFPGETLYGLLNKIASIYSGPDYTGVFALSSLVVCGFLFLALRTTTVNMPYSVLIFIVSGFYFWSFNVVRQMCAMAIFLFAYQFIEKKQPLKYVLLILCASEFHTTALLYLPVYFIKKVRLNFKVILALSIILLSFPIVFVNLAYKLTSSIQPFRLYLTRYLDNSRFTGYTESSLAHVFIHLSFLLLYVLIKKIYDKKGDISNVWIVFQFFAFAFASLATILPLANRISRLFAIVQIFSIPIMTGLITDAKIRVITNIAIVVCYLAYCVVTFYILGYHDVFPYQTIFERGY
jgi:hypothetical protein